MKTILSRLSALFGVIVLGVVGTLAAKPALAAPLPPITSVSTDATGRLIVNDKPFFPILLYDAPADDATLTQLGDFGFNTITAADGKVAATLPAYGFYAQISAPKKTDDASGVLLVSSVDSPVLELKGDVIGQTVAANNKAAVNCPGRPVSNAIGFWLNEPAGVVAGTLPGKAQYEDLVIAIDVAEPYLYPLPYQPVSSVGDAVARAHAASGGKKMVLPVLQLFTWDEKDRYPTPTELRCMVYLSLAEGANGIGYYTYTAVKAPKHAMPAELWQSVKPLNAEVAKVGQRLLENKPFTGVKVVGDAPAVKWRAVEGMLVIVNGGSTAQTVHLEFEKTPLQVRYADGTSVNITVGTLALSLAPMQVTVLEF